MKYFSIITFFIFTGCSHNHINIEKYKPVTLTKSPNIPSKKELNKKSMSVVVLNIDHQINNFAKEANIGYSLARELIGGIVENKRIHVLKRLEKPTFINELKKYEYAKKVDVKGIENSDYLLTGEITQADHKQRYHPTKERSQGGVSSPWTSYLACLKGNIYLFKLPSMKIAETFPFDECVHDSRMGGGSYDGINQNLSKLLTRTAPLVVASITPKISKSFKPRGYVESMRIDGDKKIIKTTLNRTLGAVEGRKVEIVKIEKEKNLSGEEDIIEIPIGSGTISDIITDSYSFVTVDELRGEIHRGDVVRVR